MKLSTENNEPKIWENQYVAFVSINVLKLIMKLRVN
jgi:hypothetical protein